MTYRLAKSRRILKNAAALYKKKSSHLLEGPRNKFAALLEKLDEAVFTKNKADADFHARQVETFTSTHFPKTYFDHAKELVSALAFAIIVAFTIRQLWFELYEVPTGSMRPTIEELDRLVVSKTTFGFNFPFQKGLTFFNEDRIRRAGIIVFTVEGMDVPDADTMYFYVFPGKKRYVKRCLGKPGDTVYFYGGLLYLIDRDGNRITELADPEFLKSIGISQIDHIPYISLEGKPSLNSPLARGVYGELSIRQMNEKVATVSFLSESKMEGKFFNGSEWVKDNPAALKGPHDKVESYSDLWGIGNYAMARLLTKKEASAFYPTILEDAPLYLELHHTPNLTYPQPELRRCELGQVCPTLTPMTALIPLQRSHLEVLQKSLYTARFFIQDGHAYRYQEGRMRPQRPDYDPLFPGVPDGLYEFYYGTAYKVHFGGLLTKLPSDHPLYSASSENVQKLFNLGIGFNLVYQPMAAYQPFMPQRFAYFRDGDLYVMGAPLLKKEDPTLKAFVQKEMEKEKKSSNERPYIAFVDRGPPKDAEFIKTFGLKIPEGHVLALGDNYAMSADSRDFGFVPTENLRGSPLFTFWPPGKRIGALPQPASPWITLPNVLVALTLLIIFAIWYFYVHKQGKRRYFKR